jgi:hypothetical protein
MNFMHRDEEVDYYPSRHAPLRMAAPTATPVPARPVAGRRQKERIAKPNDFKQPGERYRSWDADRQERFVKRFADHLGHPKVSQELKSIWIDLLSKVRIRNYIHPFFSDFLYIWYLHDFLYCNMNECIYICVCWITAVRRVAGDEDGHTAEREAEHVSCLRTCTSCCC